MAFFRVSPSGVITVDTSEIKLDFEAAYKNALGADLNLDVSTPQGQLIANDTKIMTNTMNEIVNLANSFSIYTAEGQGLDIAAAFFGYMRKQGSKTVVLAKITGLAGLEIPAGSRISDGTNEYVLLDNVIIGADGVVLGEFQCDEIGAISCVAGSLTEIVTPISGWDSINNEVDGIVGNNYENDNEFRSRITANQLSIRATSILGSIVDRIAQLDDVVSVIGRENQTKSAIIIDGVTLEPNSIYLCILGGMGGDIAKTLTQTKTLGAATNGDTQISYFDSAIDYNYVYNIKRPDFIDIKVQVIYRKNPHTPLDVESRIKNTIMEHISNNPFKIGVDVSANILDKSVQGINYIDLLSFQVGVVNGNYGNFVDITISEIASLTIENIEAVENVN